MYFFQDYEYGVSNTNFQNQSIAIIVAYFIYDTIAMTYLGLIDKAIFGHHMIVTTGMYTMLATQLSGGEIMCCTFVSEVSNPFMLIRLILKDVGLRHTRAYEFCEYMYMSLYTYYRMIVGIFIIYGSWATGTAPYYISMMGTAIGFQSYYYMFRMVQILEQRYKDF